MDLITTEVVGNAFQSASGMFKIINPTFAVLTGGLALARVSFNKWLKFVWPLLLILFVIYVFVLSVDIFFPGTIF
jgi:uncharacterized ion transporter superfamily protein YfcC